MHDEQGPNPPAVHLTIAASSDTGRARSANQDYAYAGAVPAVPEWTLLAVADGLGGHARGEWASQRAIELLAGMLGQLLSSLAPSAALSKAFAHINETIHGEGRATGAAGAATTLVVAIVRGTEAWWANVGDSRLYRSHAGRIEQVSHDHSWVAEEVRHGRLSPAAAKAHPEKNVVTRTIGFESTVAPEIAGPLLLRSGEALLLCSDGLHGPVADEHLARCATELDPAHAAERLIDLANEAGGPDNITVVIGKLDAPTAPAARTELTEQPPRETRRKRRRVRLVLCSGIAAALAAAAAAVPAVVLWL